MRNAHKIEWSTLGNELGKFLLLNVSNVSKLLIMKRVVVPQKRTAY